MQKILYVEDDLSLIDGLKYTLENSGYFVDNARTASEALARFKQDTYDLLLLDAFAALPKQEQSILILFCVLELGDGEIGDLMGMSRSAVQRHRTKTLNELQKKLKAHLPEGG